MRSSLNHRDLKKYENFSKKELGVRLARLMRVAEAEDIPVLIIIDGFESSGKGYVINDLVEELNPKYYDVDVFDRPSEEENRYPFMTRFWRKIPRKGHTKVFDRSFYFEVMSNPTLSEKKTKKMVDGISSIERVLYDDYTVIVKVFLEISQEVQKETIDKYLHSKYNSFYVDKIDLDQNKNYDKYRKHIKYVLEESNFSFAPWNIIDSTNRKSASKDVLGLVIEELTKGIERVATKREEGIRLKRNYIPLNRPIDHLDMKKSLSQEEYDKVYKDLQSQAADISYRMYSAGIPSIIVFEGVDAAGKDGAIKRLVKKMDPRLYTVHAISAPDETENSYNYLWRFFTKIPEDGYMGIFSRSWYGRVMVERVEGFAQDNEWERAYDEILDMEKQFYDHGAFLLKFFVVIDKDTQLERFESREEVPDKQYKITEEDWRNRDKWDEYLDAMNEMLDRTDVEYAPWVLVEGNDKNYARVKVLEKFIEYGTKRLEELEKEKK
ncbi:hypothetical protein [Lagierella sp.]|uniref:hypothetical protein n=1 Tax=Lagierella sp. TaxID=2849657 RepID=UPI002633544F|nr:hypothetical protein [Lagierella sp.]